MKIFNRKNKPQKNSILTDKNARIDPVTTKTFKPFKKFEKSIKFEPKDIHSGRYKVQLYRFLSDNIPVVNACVWTWVRLAAAKGKFTISNNHKSSDNVLACLDDLSKNIYSNISGNRTGLVSFLVDLFEYLFRDGFFGGILTVNPDYSGVDQFILLDPAKISLNQDATPNNLLLENNGKYVTLNRPDFYYIPLSNSRIYPLGRSILQAIPFISYIEQQLVDDMRRSSHNSGFHKLHVKITPPERFAGESETGYVNRINNYFDSTVSMIKSCEVDENPVTWDNVLIESIGPDNARSVSNSWFMNHRAMVEEICAGTNLAPFLLGYSYGATTTWSGFKFDMVMRQIKSIQHEIAHFLEWIGNIHLALSGFDSKCKFEFDNTFPYQANEIATVKTSQLDNLLKLYDKGLLEKDVISQKAQELI